MINVAICDDREFFSKMVYNLLTNICKEKNVNVVIDIFENGDKLLSKLKNIESQYNIVFMNIDADIYNLNGITLAKHIKKINSNIQIIFFSKNKDYVFEGYNIGISNYIIIPIDEKIKPIHKEKIAIEFLKSLKKIYQLRKNLFVIKKRDSLKVLNIEDILFFETNNRFITVVTKNGKINFYEKLANLEKKLSEKFFIRCHRGFLINPEHIIEIKKEHLYLNYNYTIPISRLRISKVKQQFINYLNNNNTIILNCDNHRN